MIVEPPDWGEVEALARAAFADSPTVIDCHDFEDGFKAGYLAATNRPEKKNTPHPGVFWQEAIQRRDITQVIVARRIGCSEKHLSQIVQGWAQPSADLTRRFGQFLTVDGRALWRLQADYLYDLTEETTCDR